MISKQVRLLNAVQGKIKVEDFEIVDVEIPELESGEVLVENAYCSTDPYIRPSMGITGDVFHTKPGEPITGDAVGTVIASKNDDVPIGTNVLHRRGWRTHSILSNTKSSTSVNTGLSNEDLVSIIPDNKKLLDYLSMNGLVGVTAYYSLKKVLNPQPGDIVAIDGATGGVGQMFIQMAVASGIEVYGITSTQEKVDYINRIGGIGVLVPAQGGLAKIHKVYNATFPNGIDKYHANVCTERMLLGLAKLNPQAHLILCGAMKTYNSSINVLGPNIQPLIHKGGTIHGCAWVFSIDEWRQEYLDFIETHYEKLAPQYEIYHGIESMPQQFVDQFFIYEQDSNKKFGKLVTQL
jgi:NADPH-dependent curcumin reductase CurA|tara:strand:- start:3903 stop:4952 length:1050 start_codon:yes stop_codon:yes gene_type:complete